MDAVAVEKNGAPNHMAVEKGISKGGKLRPLLPPAADFGEVFVIAKDRVILRNEGRQVETFCVVCARTHHDLVIRSEAFLEVLLLPL